MALLKSVPKNQWESKKQEVLNLIKAKYRLTWTHGPTQEALANIPNLMMVDDHEIRDDFGFREEDWNPDTDKPDYFYGQLCRQVYYQYQRALRDDVAVDKADSEYWLEVLNGVGVICVEYRCFRSWHRNDKDVKTFHLGQKQLDFVKSAFGDNGAFSKVSSAIVLSPLTFVLIGQPFLKLEGKRNDDAKESWNYLDQRSEELSALLDIFDNWRSKNKSREVTLVAGDVHFGGHTEIFQNGKPCFKQFIASAMNQSELKKYQQLILEFFSGGKNDIGDKYSFRQEELVKDNNYGVVTVIKGKKDVHRCKLVAASDDKAIRDLKTYSSLRYEGSCCSIF